MTIHTLPANCWVLQWGGLPLTGANASHYETRDQAAAAIPAHGQLARHKDCGGAVLFALSAWCPACDDEAISDGDWELLPVTPAQLPRPCWIAECDCGNCAGDLLGEDDGYVLHRCAEAEITACAWQHGWQVTVSGLAYPDRYSLPPGAILAARPPGRGRQPLFAALPVAGTQGATSR